MKKKLIFVSILFALLIPRSVYALNCVTVQGPGTPERCLTEVTISSAETTLVSEGTALVWDSDGSTPAQAGYQVRVSRASADNTIAAGFAVRNMVTGETGAILVHGWGHVRTVGGVATGDSLVVAASANVATVGGSSPFPASVDPVATALEASATNNRTMRWAYIRL